MKIFTNKKFHALAQNEILGSIPPLAENENLGLECTLGRDGRIIMQYSQRFECWYEREGGKSEYERFEGVSEGGK